MKIIGENVGGFIVEVTNQELEKLVGYFKKGHRFDIGTVIEISKLFDQLYKLQDRKGTLESIALSLEGIAGLVRIHSPVIDEIAGEIKNQL